MRVGVEWGLLLFAQLGGFRHPSLVVKQERVDKLYGNERNLAGQGRDKKHPHYATLKDPIRARCNKSIADICSGPKSLWLRGNVQFLVILV